MKLRFVQHAFMAVHDVLRPVLASLVAGRQRLRDLVNAWAHMVVASIWQHGHQIACREFVFDQWSLRSTGAAPWHRPSCLVSHLA